jgi:hypothetical protein
VAHLPPTLSHLLLQALFMQISGMSFTLTSSCKLCLFRVLLDTCPFVCSIIQPFPPFAIAVFFYYLQFAWRSALPLIGWSVPHFSRCYKPPPLQGCWVGATAPAFSHQLVYLQFEWVVPLPHSLELRAPHPFCYMSFFFSAAYLLFRLVFFSFFPG